MPTIYDNIEKRLEEGLINTFETSKRADFCIRLLQFARLVQSFGLC